ncbi:MAG TPA: NADH-quinone oxidoreductase subunit C [Nitrososphaeraceae archaeon]|jgi:NADH-quinone oxidoreductase subunit C|nr:NADH-quinone oxidoreductase subunit C [Nitrososphaeraceae archaeon]
MSKSNGSSPGNDKGDLESTVTSNKDLQTTSGKQEESGSGSPKSSNNTSVQVKSEKAELPQFEKGIIDSLVLKFGDSIKIVYVRPLRIKIEVPSKDIVEIARHIRDESGFDHAESVSATDYPKTGDIEVIYHLGSYTRENLSSHIFSLSTRTDRNNARLPSLIEVFRSVEYHERESFEMVGVYFDNHPRNDRFLLPEDWADIPPLRKEFRIKGR